VRERVLVTTLTKKMAEDLTDYLQEVGIKVRYIHSDVETIERVDIIRDLRRGEFDVLVGINLLREGLDLPEVSLVGILDADKEGYLRSERSLIQTIGRAARNVNGAVLPYPDTGPRLEPKGVDRAGPRPPGAEGVHPPPRHHPADYPEGDRRAARGRLRSRLFDRAARPRNSGGGGGARPRGRRRAGGGLAKGDARGGQAPGVRAGGRDPRSHPGARDAGPRRRARARRIRPHPGGPR